MNKSFVDACEDGDIDFVKFCLAIPDFDPALSPGLFYISNSAIAHASQNGHTEIVKLLLNHPKVNPADNANYAIRTASYNNRIEVVKLLLTNSRVNPTDCDHDAIELASKYGHIEVVKLLSEWYFMHKYNINNILSIIKRQKYKINLDDIRQHLKNIKSE